MSGDYSKVANFTPEFGTGQAVSASTTSASAPIDAAQPELYVFNDSSVVVYCRWGVGAQTATTAGLPIPAGSAQIFFKGNADTFAAITASGTASVRIITGFGQ